MALKQIGTYLAMIALVIGSLRPATAHASSLEQQQNENNKSVSGELVAMPGVRGEGLGFPFSFPLIDYPITGLEVCVRGFETRYDNPKWDCDFSEKGKFSIPIDGTEGGIPLKIVYPKSYSEPPTRLEYMVSGEEGVIYVQKKGEVPIIPGIVRKFDRQIMVKPGKDIKIVMLGKSFQMLCPVSQDAQGFKPFLKGSPYNPLAHPGMDVWATLGTHLQMPWYGTMESLLIDRYGSPAIEFKIWGTDITIFVTHLSPEIDGKYPVLDLAGVTLEEYKSAISEFKKSYNKKTGIGKIQYLTLRHNPFFKPGDDIPMKVALEGLTKWPHIHAEIRVDKSISPTGYANPAFFLNCDD